MKTLMLFIALTASVWSSFSYAQSNQVMVSFRQGQSLVSVIKTPDLFFSSQTTEAAAIADFKESVTVIQTSWNCPIVWVTGSNNWTCWREGMTNPLNGYATFSTQLSDYPASQTCKGLDGAFIDGYHNSENDFCAIVGSTGGPSPQPLLCTATMIAEIPAFSGNFQHIVTANACSAETGPTAPDDGTDPGEPCTENCEPTDPETPPGGDDGSDIPGTGDGPSSSNTTVTGTATDSAGNVTNINLEMDQDFSPITDRQNETNERLKVENQNSANLIEKVNGLGQGLIEANDNLEGIRDAIGDLGNPDMSGIEGKLDGIKESIDGIKDGMGTAEEGEAAADGVSLPDYQRTIDNGFGDIIGAINSDDNNQKEGQLLNLDENLRAFSSVPALFDFAADNCQPLSFGNNISFDLCPYASTSSSILYWVFTVLTIIFLIQSISADVKKIRMS